MTGGPATPAGPAPAADPDPIAGLTFRRPVEADHARIVEQVDDWWGGRRLHDLLPRLWFQHFSGTSWTVLDDGGQPVGFLVGFVSPDHPDEAYIHMVGVHPNHRRAGLGRALYARFIGDVEACGVRRIRSITWPGNRVSVAFHRSMGFRPDEGPGTQRLYGTPAYPDYDGHGDDRVAFVRDLAEESVAG
jgi:ribosomal protein S18 acetylase RimI-like enzyme